MYVPCDTHKFPVKSSKHTPSKPTQRHFPDPSDEVTYPELYRKSEYIKGSNSDVPTPFQIGMSFRLMLCPVSILLHTGQIVKIARGKKEQLWLTLEMFYR